MINLEDLYKKYPFVYELDEEYFFLGWEICKPCNSEMAIYYYKKYEELVQKIGEEILALRSYDIDETELESLIKSFRKVKAYSDIATDENCDIATDENEMAVFRDKLNNFVATRCIEQQETLLRQLKNFALYIICLQTFKLWQELMV